MLPQKNKPAFQRRPGSAHASLVRFLVILGGICIIPFILISAGLIPAMIASSQFAPDYARVAYNADLVFKVLIFGGLIFFMFLAIALMTENHRKRDDDKTG